MSESKRFIIVCPARSGSTMLVHMLRSHPDCMSHSEVMAFTDTLGGFDPIVKPHLASLGTDDELIRWRQNDPVDFMNRVAFDARDRLWGGFKIKSDELALRKYGAVLAALRADRSIKVLHLNRSNLLERYVSWVMVNKVTGVTMAVREEDKPEFEQVVINPKKAERDFVLAENRQAMLDEWFADHEMLQLDYDALTRDLVGESQRICEFLDIETRTLHTRTIKISPHVNTLVSNFDHLREHFADTRFETLFDVSDTVAATVPTEPSITVPNPDDFRIPGNLRTPSCEWGVGGASFHDYVAAVCDVGGMNGKVVLAVGDHADMVEAIARGVLSVDRYIGLCDSSALVEFCEENVPDPSVQLIEFDPERLVGDPQWLLPRRVEMAVVRTTPVTARADHLEALLRGVRSVTVDGGCMLLEIPLADSVHTAGEQAWQRDDLVALLDATGWSTAEVRGPRRSLTHHLVCRPLDRAEAANR